MRRLWNAFFYSLAGLRAAWDEPAARLEIYLLVVAVPLALWLPLGVLEKLLLIGATIAIFVVEILNTSVEAAIDRISAERHQGDLTPKPQKCRMKLSNNLTARGG